MTFIAYENVKVKKVWSPLKTFRLFFSAVTFWNFPLPLLCLSSGGFSDIPHATCLSPFVDHKGWWETQSNNSPSIGLSICLSACQSAWLLGSQYVRMSVCLSCCPLYIPAWLPANRTTCLPVSPHDGLPVWLPACLSMCLRSFTWPLGVVLYSNSVT